MSQLHERTEQLLTAGEALDEAMADSEYRHQERVNVAAKQFREAERALEQVDRAIEHALHP